MSSKPMKPTKHLDTTLIPNTRRICQVKKYGLLSVWLKSASVGCGTRYTDVFVARIDTMQTIGTHLCAASHAANPSDLFSLLHRYCYVCESHTPPRCSHCYDCNVCVLRRDHHCVFFGQCVGFRNFRYFLSCLLFMWCGLLYATLMNAEVFIVILKEGVTVHSVLLLFVPWIMLLSGKIWLFTHGFAVVFNLRLSCLVRMGRI